MYYTYETGIISSLVEIHWVFGEGRKNIRALGKRESLWDEADSTYLPSKSRHVREGNFFFSNDKSTNPR